MNIFTSLKTTYRNLSIAVFTTIILWVIINLFCALYFKLQDTNNNPPVYSNIDLNAFLNKKFAINVDSNYVTEVLHDFRLFNEQEKSAFEYYPAMSYTHRPFSSEHLNIVKDENDLPQRLTVSEITYTETDSVISIYCFGGSTTMGWNVSDEHTWPSLLVQHIQERYPGCRIIVKNYGVPGFSVTQETNQFINLLKLGHRPSLCIFMDGVNTGPVYDGSEFSKGIAQRFEEDPGIENFLQKLPVTRFINSVLHRDQSNYTDDPQLLPIEHSNEYNDLIVNRFVQNAEIRMAVAEVYGVEIIQFMQPNVFTCNENYFLADTINSLVRESPVLRNMKLNYSTIYSRILTADAGFEDLSYILYSYPYLPVYDGLHYSPNFNDHLARNVMNELDLRSMEEYEFEEGLSTGLVFDY